MKRPTEVTTIDDILHPGERERTELATLDAGMARINSLLHALSALDGSASPAATGFPPHGHGHLERADSSAPGLQAPVLTDCFTLSWGQVIFYRVTQQLNGIWCARELDSADGRGGWGATPASAIEDLQILKESGLL